jgi:hypothetical protein
MEEGWTPNSMDHLFAIYTVGEPTPSPQMPAQIGAGTLDAKSPVQEDLRFEGAGLGDPTCCGNAAVAQVFTAGASGEVAAAQVQLLSQTGPT